MSEGTDRDRSKREQRNLARKRRGRWWILLIGSVLAVIVAGTIAYRWFKGQRAERFAAAGEALVAADKWNDAAVGSFELPRFKRGRASRFESRASRSARALAESSGPSPVHHPRPRGLRRIAH